VAPPHLPSPAEHTKHKILETFLSNLARMGNSGAKPLLFGTIKVTGADLYDEGVVVLSPGELEIGKSKELTFKITSQTTGVFTIVAQYLGSSLKEVQMDHADVIKLLHESETSEVYQRLAAVLGFQRGGTSITFGRAFKLDCTKLLPYLYERFAQQNLAQIGETLVKEYSSPSGGGGGGDSSSNSGGAAATAKAEASGAGGKGGGETIESNIAALEDLEAQMRAGK